MNPRKGRSAQGRRPMKPSSKSRSSKEANPQPPRRAPRASGKMVIEGRRPVLEALRAGMSIERILVADGARGLDALLEKADERQVPVERVAAERIADLADTPSPQGVLAYVPFPEPVEWRTLLERARRSGEPPLLVLADGIEDPRNLGALLRSADGAGAHGVIVPKRRASGLTAAAVKASAGAAAHVPVAEVSNMAQAMDALKAEGIWLAGASMDGGRSFWEADLKGPLGIVIGGEGRGLRRLVAERCDFLVRIPMLGSIESLNASVAGALLLYEALRQRQSNSSSS